MKTPHLAASLVALSIAAAISGAGVIAGRFLERRYLPVLAPILFPQKNQGIALQKLAFHHHDLLPIYGSSELVKRSGNRAADLFRSYPTGFSVFVVGKAGASSLIILQKLAAVGSDLDGKKLVISLSPSWFFHDIPVSYYNGNFSLLQAGELIYSGQLSFSLKCDIARRMLRYPDTLKKSVLLAFALKQIAANSPVSRVLYYLTVPLGMMENGILRVQDYFETLFFMAKQWRALQVGAKRSPNEIDWAKLIARTASRTGENKDSDIEPVGAEMGSAAFARGVEGAREWTDLELLLRGLNELRARPLLLSMPIDGRYFDRFGVGRETRDLYYKRIRALAQRHQVPLIDFEEHDEDGDLLAGHHDHLSEKGWLYFDQALDDFFHDRLASEPTIR